MSLHLFEAIGIELEYMLVDRESLAVRPIADELLKQVGGGYEMEVELGPIAWSNELALHVIELKTNGPVSELAGVEAQFQQHIGKIERLISPLHARLMPSGMHPFMDPHHELVLWPHEDDVIYRTFDRIFDCRGHGWANLQSMHINLPFSGDDEFGALHAAIRLVLPILPALAASSPFVDAARSAWLDARLEYYRNNAARVPQVTGQVVPEPVFTAADYQRLVLEPIYAALRADDPDGVLRHEWINARGCIARFDRSAIEIRLLDLQECPRADLAIAALVVASVRALCSQQLCSSARQRAFEVEPLSAILLGTIRQADDYEIVDREYLGAFGHPGPRCRAGELWQHLLAQLPPAAIAPAFEAPLALILEQGCLARRLLRAVGEPVDRERLREVYRQLCDCLSAGELFIAKP